MFWYRGISNLCFHHTLTFKKYTLLYKSYVFKIILHFIYSQLQQLEDTRALEMEDVDQVTKEFTKRLSDSEKMYQQAVRVRI